jgi:DNA polymerase-1
MATTYQLLGVVDGKEYHLDLRKTIKQAGVEAPNPDFGKVVFRVPDIREGIHAEPGMKILCCDYSQIEVRLMAFLSGDPKLKAALNKGGDIHCYTAVDCFGQEYGFDYEQISKGRKNEADPRFLLFKALRSKTKAVTFGTPYGAGPPRIAAQCNEGKRPDDPSFMTIDQAAELIARFFSKYPVLKAWLSSRGGMPFAMAIPPRREGASAST